MAVVFGIRSVIFADYLEKRRIIMSQYNDDHHETCSFEIAKAKLGNKLRIAASPTHSLDLASSDMFLILNMKQWLGSKRFSILNHIFWMAKCIKPKRYTILRNKYKI